MSVTVIEFITLDGIVSDPDGSEGTPARGWAFRPFSARLNAVPQLVATRTLTDTLARYGRAAR